MSVILSCCNVRKAFNAEPPIVALDGVNADFRENEIAAITGMSGKGKSTLLGILSGISQPDDGFVRYMGEDLARISSSRLDAIHRRGIGLITQDPLLFQALTARENLQFAAKVQPGFGDANVDEILEKFGLSERADHLPCELSVGQRRRLVIARVLYAGHNVILADEPTNDLDSAWVSLVAEMFEAFARQPGHVLVVVTHDERFAARADVEYELNSGVLAKKRGVQ